MDHAQIIKIYGYEEVINNRRYTAPEFVSAEKKIVVGSPNVSLISTSYIKRLNATTRLHMRRFTRSRWLSARSARTLRRQSVFTSRTTTS